MQVWNPRHFRGEARYSQQSASLQHASGVGDKPWVWARFGGRSRQVAHFFVLDIEQYRYQKFISDIAGQDIRSHDGNPDRAIRAVRNWLATASKREDLPGGTDVINRYARFQTDLPRTCEKAKLDPDDLTFSDLSNTIASWLKTNP